MKLYTVKQVSQMVGRSVTSVHRIATKKQIGTVIGLSNYRLFTEDDVASLRHHFENSKPGRPRKDKLEQNTVNQ